MEDDDLAERVQELEEGVRHLMQMIDHLLIEIGSIKEEQQHARH